MKNKLKYSPVKTIPEDLDSSLDGLRKYVRKYPNDEQAKRELKHWEKYLKESKWWKRQIESIIKYMKGD